MNKLIEHLEQSIERADRIDSKLNEKLQFDLPPGMSGKKVRALLNNICSMDDTRYLEVGLWQGSTMCSAMHGNEMRAVGIDNWSEYGGPKKYCIQSIGQFSGMNEVSIHDMDCYRFFTGERFNVFFFDGGHSVLDHYRAIAHFGPMMDREFILLVDDFRSQEVSDGTDMALSDLGYEPLFQIFKGFIGRNEDEDGWWNGLYCGVIRKPE